MSELTIADYKGKVTKCGCSNPDKPEQCSRCFARGFLAECLACRGTGRVEVPISGASGAMQGTCNWCGGRTNYPANKPENYDAITVALALPASTEAVEIEA